MEKQNIVIKIDTDELKNIIFNRITANPKFMAAILGIKEEEIILHDEIYLKISPEKLTDIFNSEEIDPLLEWAAIAFLEEDENGLKIDESNITVEEYLFGNL